MKKVTCINDKNLPQGASVKENIEYIVEEEYINALDQRVYIIEGAPNQGTTKMGMRWVGYDATRFREKKNSKQTEKQEEKHFALN